MYICVCKAIKEQDIHDAALNGARTIKDLSDKLGVGKDCGLCIGCAKQCLHEAKDAVTHQTALGNCAAA